MNEPRSVADGPAAQRRSWRECTSGGCQRDGAVDCSVPVGKGTYYGGKARWSDAINERLGTVVVYVEPCAGSFANGLRRPPSPREIMCDTDHLLVNLWRAIRDAPDAVAYHASWPTFHADLTARQPWLINWRREHGWRVTEDPDFHDAKVAGWWCWGASNWIGGGWCAEKGERGFEQVPATGFTAGVHALKPGGPRVADDGRGGQGVQAQRVSDKVPNVGDKHGGRAGVSAQRCDDKRPHVAYGGGFGVQPQRNNRPAMQNGSMGGIGVQARSQRYSDEGDILDGTRWQPWFRALAKRLERVVILNRTWQSAVTSSMLQHTPSGPQPTVGIFFDPPYLVRNKTGARDGAIYHGDEHADQVARETFEWCTTGTDKKGVRHCEKYRIAYACHEGDFEVPAGWDAEVRKFAGVRDAKRRAERSDMILFSPLCVREQREFDW